MLLKSVILSKTKNIVSFKARFVPRVILISSTYAKEFKFIFDKVEIIDI